MVLLLTELRLPDTIFTQMIDAHPNTLTVLAEVLAQSLFIRAGYQVNYLYHEYCLLVSKDNRQAKVSVRAARRSYQGFWQFKTLRNDSPDYLMLIQLVGSDPVLYLIPAQDIAAQTRIILNNPETYGGKFIKYRVSPDELGLVV